MCRPSQISRLSIRLAAIAVVALVAGPGFAQQAGENDPNSPAPVVQESTPSEPAAEGAPPSPPATVEEAVEGATGVDRELEGQPVEVTRAYLDRYMDLIRAQQAALEAITGTGPDNPARQRETETRADLQTLITVAEGVAKTLSQAGEDMQSVRQELSALRGASVTIEPTDPDTITRTSALDLDKEVLKAQLRPMTLASVELEASTWLKLLRETCSEISAKEIAGLNDQEGQARFNEQAVLLRGQRGRLIERIKIILDAMDKKGGDSSSARAYVASVVATPPITGLNAAVTSLMAWLKSPDGGVAIGMELLQAIGALLIALVLSRIIGKVVQRAVGRVRGSSSLLRNFVVAAVRKSILLVGFLVALSVLGVNMGPMVAAIGAAGLVLGLALQGTLGNLASGLMIMIFRPFDVEDVVLTAGAHGRVMGMTLMTTTIRTMDNRTVHVPNSMVWGDVITNITANGTRRVDMVFGIGYGCDFARAREVLLEILTSHEKVLDDPEPNVRVHELGDSSVNLITRPWVHTPDYWEVMWDVTEAVKRRFDEEGIQIPFPQRDVHFYNEGPPAPSPPNPSAS